MFFFFCTLFSSVTVGSLSSINSAFGFGARADAVIIVGAAITGVNLDL